MKPFLSLPFFFLSLFGTLSAQQPIPTPQQIAWQEDEVSMFFHYDIPIYTDGGNGNVCNWMECGNLDPSLLNPQKLNTDQWMEAAKAIGAKHTVFVAKHCSGFILWQSNAYPYGLKQSKWHNGRGDILRDYLLSSKKASIKPGIYISWPANGHFGVQDGKVKDGDPKKQAAYVKAYEKLASEAFGNYGPFFEIWFDGGLPSVEKGGPDVMGILKKHQPKAILFQGPASSIRWVGNEHGKAPDPCWATVAARSEHGDGYGYGSGDPEGKVWLPAECDVPIRNHEWFWQPNSESKIYSLEQLMEMYYLSVGRNCNLLLNANIDRDGLVPEADMKRYKEFGAEIKRRFGKSLAETSGHGETVTLDLGKPMEINHIILQEDIRQGERVREFMVEAQVNGNWQQLVKAQCIGHKRIDRFPSIEATQIRVRVSKSTAEPLIRKLAVFNVK